VASWLKPLAVDHRSRTADDVTVLTQCYLVRADDLERFDAAVQELREELGDRYAVDYVGPLPPLDFPEGGDGPTQASLGATTTSRWGW
jgi:hypothetical protein